MPKKKRIEERMSDYIKESGLSAELHGGTTTYMHDTRPDDTPKPPNIPIDPYDELKAYLEEKDLPFKPELRGGKDESVAREFKQFLDAGRTAEDFYREGETCVYHSLHMEGDVWQQPYKWILREALPPPRTLLDFGCGCGGNGLYFAAHGYDVSFADLETKCTDFLKWRLGLRGTQKRVYNIEAEELPQHDIAIAFDVIEHVPDPLSILKQLERAGKVVAVNLLTKIPETKDESPQLHYRLDVEKILDYVRSNKKILIERDLDYAIYLVYQS